MRDLWARYSIGLLSGVVFGLIFPTLIPQSLLFACVLGVLVGNEIVGRWGFGSHWDGYRLVSYALYTGVAVCAWIGVLLGSGKIGSLLVSLGSLIS